MFFYYRLFTSCLQWRYPVPERRRRTRCSLAILVSYYSCTSRSQLLVPPKSLPQPSRSRSTSPDRRRSVHSSSTTAAAYRCVAWCLGQCVRRPGAGPRMTSRGSCKSWTRSADGEYPSFHVARAWTVLLSDRALGLCPLVLNRHGPPAYVSSIVLVAIVFYDHPQTLRKFDWMYTCLSMCRYSWRARSTDELVYRSGVYYTDFQMQ